jgi:glyoxylase-like metal-dependent hydrolase (beta-lactamase superfamily II)
MNSYQITLLKMGETRVPAAEVFWMERLTGWENLTFWAFLITDGQRRILLNTGFPQDISALYKHWTTWARAATGEAGHEPVVKPDNWIVQALAAHRIAPAQINDVLITPLTAYATGGLNQFPNARIWMSRRGWLDFHAPDPEVPQLPRPIVFPPAVLNYLIQDAASRIALLPDAETEFIPGIQAWFCGGHHRSSMVYLVPTSAGRVAMTDAIFTYRNFEQRIPLGLSESLEEHHKLYAKLARQADMVIPLYDPLVEKRHPTGRIGEL